MTLVETGSPHTRRGRMENDDKQIGQLLSRREAIILLGLAGVSAATACSKSETASAASVPASGSLSDIPGCVVRPEQTAGPYYVDEKLKRSDIRSDPSDGSVKDGAPLELTFNVTQLAGSKC